MLKRDNFFESEKAQCLSLIAELQDMAANGAEEKDFAEARKELNLHLIQAAAGGEVKRTRKGSWTIKLHREAPSSGLMQLINALDRYAMIDERDYLTRHNKKEKFAVQNGPLLVAPEKLNKASLYSALFESNIMSAHLVGEDLSQIYSLAHELRKRINRRNFIIAGIGVTVTAGGLIVLHQYRAKKAAESVNDDNIDVEAETVDDDVAVNSFLGTSDWDW